MLRAAVLPVPVPPLLPVLLLLPHPAAWRCAALLLPPAASRPPPRLSLAICETTSTPSARQAMSAVKTGMPAALASSIAGPIYRESQGQSTIAEQPATMKSFTWFCCLATSNSPLVIVVA